MYTVKFEFMVGEHAINSHTGNKVKIVGTYYCNGINNLFPSESFFHDIMYVVEDNGKNIALMEEELKKV